MKNWVKVFWVTLFCIQLNYAQPLTFNFTTTGTSGAMDTAIQYAGSIWSGHLNSLVPVDVHVHYVFMIVPGLKMFTISNLRKDFSAAEFDSTWYPTSLANKMEGVELNPGEADMDIFISDAFPWYLGTDLNCGETEYDFVTYFLRELAHGLGVMSINKVDNDSIGSIGTLTGAELNEFQPSSYVYPNLDKKYSVFDRFLENGAGNLITDTVLFPNPSVALFDFFTSDDVFFNGTMAMAENGNALVPVYAPTSFTWGATLQTLNETDYASGTNNGLLTPDIQMAEVIRMPGNVILGMLDDMGWTVHYHSGIENEQDDFSIYPNPARDVIHLRNHLGEVKIINIHGEIIQTAKSETNADMVLDISELERGMYFVWSSHKVQPLIKN